MNTIKWIILILCFVGWYFLTKTQSISSLELLFEHPYQGNWQSELNAVPLITDIDGDGKNDLVVAPFMSQKISIYSFNQGKLTLKKETSIPNTTNVIYLTSGYEKEYKENLRREQVIIVVLRNFEVRCYTSDLKLRWKQQIYSSLAQPYVQEVSGVVIPYQIQTKYQGAVITAFRTSNDKAFVGNRADTAFEWDERNDFNKPIIEQNENSMDDGGFVPELIEHMNYYAFSIKDGQVIWQHERDDEDQNDLQLVHQEDNLEVYKNLKMGKSILHDFDTIQWHEFHDCIFQNLPHTWSSYYDTHIVPAHFSRDIINNPTEYIHPKHSIYNSFNQFDLIKNPNVLVVHHMNGIEVIHLFTGKPLLHVTLLTSTISAASSFADIDGDDELNEVYTHANLQYSELEQTGDDYSCYVHATVVNTNDDLFLFNLCEQQQRFNLFRKQSNTEKQFFQVLPPLLIPNNGKAHDGRPTYDIYTLSNNGLLTALHNDGTLLWNKMLPVNWELNQVDLITFKPSFHLFQYSYKNQTSSFIYIQGDNEICILDLNGNLIGSENLKTKMKPIMPPIFGDLTNDMKTDILFITEHSLVAYHFELLPSIEFLPICISFIVLMISYNIYLVVINYYKKIE
ncbi:FG-GAP repeat-containing protein [Entamoeba histolytica HM-3:IMSS]|uniref:FG-GAP repeat-containing protein n=1 Tax=Entamoeba histolytica HM-3:IMSS TaxID=885315 RepID=M7W983_ENTHI|nr:FG-GAP repeat-containing protein [Entamoeba histolytica HM-3:IMSS]